MLIFRIRKLREVLNSQAIRRKGEVTKGNIFFYPVLRFFYKNNKIEVYSKSGQVRSRTYASPPYTYVEVKLGFSVDQNFRIFKEKTIFKIGKALGMQDIQTGNDIFDKNVIVKATDESYINNILSSSIQEKIMTIINNNNAHIYLQKNKLSIAVPDIIYKEEEYDNLIDTALIIVKKISGEFEY